MFKDPFFVWSPKKIYIRFLEIPIYCSRLVFEIVLFDFGRSNRRERGRCLVDGCPRETSDVSRRKRPRREEQMGPHFLPYQKYHVFMSVWKHEEVGCKFFIITCLNVWQRQKLNVKIYPTKVKCLTLFFFRFRRQ